MNGKIYIVVLLVSIALNIYLACLCCRDNPSGAADVHQHSQQLGDLQQKQDGIIRDAKETNSLVRDANIRLSELERSDAARIAELKRILQGVQQRDEAKAP